MLKTILAVLVLTAAAVTTTAAAGVVERACLQSGRQGSTAALCGCIQDVANLTLDRREQSRTAGLFRDPGSSAAIQQSGSRANTKFWKKYKYFSDNAKLYCSPG